MNKYPNLLSILFFGGLLFLFSCGQNADMPEAEVGDKLSDLSNDIQVFITSGKLSAILLVLFTTWGLSYFLRLGFYQAAKSRFYRDRLKILRVLPFFNVALWTFVVIILLRSIFPKEEIWAFLASSTLVLGFAAQDALKNILGGLWLLIDHPFQIGDRINVMGQYGEVESINIRTVRLRTPDGNLVTIPNSVVVNESVVNASRGALEDQVITTLWLPIDADLDIVRKIAYEAAITSRYLNFDRDEPVTILFFDNNDNEPATRLVIKAYVLDLQFEKAFEADITEKAKKAFRIAGVY